MPRSRSRREEIRRVAPRSTLNFRAILQRPELIHTTLILTGFLIVISLVVAWSREQVKVRDGQIMTETAIKRVDYQILDEQATQTKRQEARESSPRYYVLNDSYLDRLEAALLGLPKAVQGKVEIEEISEDLREEFSLSEESLRHLQSMVMNDEPTPQWTAWVRKLVREQLVRNPVLTSQDYEKFTTTLNKRLQLPDGTSTTDFRGQVIELPTDPAEKPDERLRALVKAAGFAEPLIDVVWSRLTWEAQPTVKFDETRTAAMADQAARAVKAEMVQHRQGEVLYRRGDVLTAKQYQDVLVEADEYARSGPLLDRWLARAGVIGLVALVTVFLGSFATFVYPRVVRNPLRMVAICTLIGSMIALTVFVTTYAPIFLYPAAIGPTLFATIILLVAYDQRLSLILSGIQCMLVTMALEQSVGFFVLLIAGCATALAQLREIRHRNALIRAAVGTAAVLGVGTLMYGLVHVPLIDRAWQDIPEMALSAVLTTFGVSFVVLGILPSVEKIFDITTGMTLAELRDPKQPLLRQLQQRAPGTYNHSLQVANIAEAAADAIGADSLLVYVGALYHDVGKINKPEYFVENQTGGFNRHEKLSPAMSLLVIIGHVKNGIELAREYGLPRSLQHFIESHHGTTLVEYFYHAAKAKAEEKDEGEVAEVEYRYPGPKPRTKEAAILMLSDAVESATRAMAEPNPSRIEALVRKMSAKRLEDEQFDECELTFRELRLIEDAIINRLLAIYHSRISYPTSASRSASDDERPETPKSQIRSVSA